MVLSESERIERILATARAFLAVSSLIAIWVDPTEPSRFTGVAYGLMLLYVLIALLVFILARIRPAAGVSLRYAIHAIDIFWPAVISVFTSGPNSPFFIFYTFVLLAAAYRWGFRGTMATASAVVVLFVPEGLFALAGSRLARLITGGDFDVNRFMMRGIYLLIFGYLLGYLGEEEKRLKTEVSEAARIIGSIQAAPGLRAAMRAVFEELLHCFRASCCLLVVENARTEEAFLWEGTKDPGGHDVSVASRELGSEERALYFSKTPWSTGYGIRIGKAGGAEFWQVSALDREGKRCRSLWSPPEKWLEGRSFDSALVSELIYAEGWTGNLIILDPRLTTGRHAAVRLLHTLAFQITPAFYNVYLARRLRSEAGAAERARVARELHDGVIQSLFGMEMQVDVLRRSQSSPERTASELGRIQRLLRQEVLNLRELMQQMKPLYLDSRQLLDHLAESVNKFGRDSGIATNFTSTGQEVRLPPRVCSELARIVQESLVNIRKHSRARNVVVRFDSDNGGWKLVIDDDGRGFDFSGRLSQAELDAARKGPVVIKERVRAIGGEMVVDSRPGQGSRLEITIPPTAHG